ncbi:MAG: translocation/assembly module TamB domain-containing protein, partial [Methyloprofundus sp.]|nr:translocation/assembly module TamB domain-containing protein [Methyloprofundus sp.]
GNLELAMQGAWRAPANVWQGQIQQLKIKHSSAGKWQLIQSAPLEMKRTKQDSIQLQTDLCLTQRGSTGLVCLLAKNDLHKGQVFEGKISLLPLSIFSDYLPEAVQIDSHLQAKFFLQQTDLQGEVTLSLTPGFIRMKHEQTGVQNVSFQSAQFDSQLQEGHLQSDVSVIFNEDNHIKGQVKVTGLEHTDTANIDGLLNIQLEDIGFMDAFIDSVSDMAGEVKAQLVLQGLFSAPQLDGSKIQLSDGKLFVPEMGLQVNNINIALSHAEQQQLVLQGKAQVADEQILIDGRVEQYTSDQLKFQLAIKAKDLQVMQTPEIQLWVSPNLRLQGDKSGASLEGEVAIPKAIVIIESLPAGAVKLSDDEVIGAVKKSAPKDPAYALDANIKIRLGENVSLEGFGLKTLLQGQLQAVQKNNKLKLFNALSSVKGTYQAYGQDLDIEKGQLLF